MEKARPRPNPFPWNPVSDECTAIPKLSKPDPNSNECGRAQRVPQSLFTGSAPMRYLDSVSDDDSDVCVEETAAHALAGDVLFDAAADEYADCIGAAARARMQDGGMSGRFSRSDYIEEDLLCENVSKVELGENKLSGDEGAERDRPRPVVPWARIASTPDDDRGRFYAAELHSVRPELRFALGRILRRANAQPHRPLALNVTLLLLGEDSSLLPQESERGAGGQRARLPALAAAALQRFRDDASDVLATRDAFEALVAAREACRRWDAQEDSLFAVREGMYAWAPDMDGTLRRAAACGCMYKALSLFVECYSAGPLDSVLRSSALYVSAVLEQYCDTMLSRLEEDFEGEENRPVTGLSLLIEAEALSDDMFWLLRATESLEETRGTSSEVLDVLYRLAYRHTADQVLYKFFLASAIPYMRMIWDWMFSASCTRDGHNEFFGTVLGADIDGPEVLTSVEGPAAELGSAVNVAAYPSFLGSDLVISILRAGRARSLLGKVQPSHPLLEVAVPTFDDVFSAGSVTLSDLNAVLGRLSAYASALEAVSSSSDDEAVGPEPGKPTSSLDGSSCDGLNEDDGDQPFSGVFNFPLEEGLVADLAAKAGGALQRRKLGGFWDCTDGSVGLAKPSICGEFEAGWPPLAQLVDKMVLGPLGHVNVLIQHAVFLYFTGTLLIHEHLGALWRYALLGAGDFADVLVERIETTSATIDANELFMLHRRASHDGGKLSRLQSVAHTRQTRQRTHLAECLQSALIASGMGADPYAANISLKPVTSDEDASQASPSLWDNRIHVSYEADFPLSFVISPEVLSRYSIFFDFFLRVRRAEQCLRRLFMTCRRQSSLRAHSTHAQRALLDDVHLCTRIWRFCWEAEHFVRIIGEYEATQVVGSSWQALVERQDRMRSLEKGADVWSLRAAVIDFLDASSRRALLGKRHESVMKVIASALDVVVGLEKLLMPAVDPTMRYDAAEIGEFIREVDLAADSLQRRAKFLVVVLQKLMASGAAASQPHLTDLLNRLNYNNFY